MPRWTINNSETNARQLWHLPNEIILIIHTKYTQSDHCKVHQTTLEVFSSSEHSILVTAVKLLYKQALIWTPRTGQHLLTPLTPQKTYVFGVSTDVVRRFTVISTFCKPLFYSCTICWSMVICSAPKTENVKSSQSRTTATNKQQGWDFRFPLGHILR
jgi:hypothetical protein